MRASGWLLAAFAAAHVSAAAGQVLEADLSTHEVAITSSYVGEDLILFGARQGEGEIIVVIRGPEAALVVRRKERVAGLWLNRAFVAFRNVPGLYAIAASAEPERFAAEAFLVENEVGIGRLRLETVSGASAGEFAAALVRDRQREGLYAADVAPVRFVGEHLFRVEFHLPAAAPAGRYTATIFLLRGGNAVASNTAVLEVTKAGVGRAVYDYSRQQPTLYGIFAVILALLAGWLAAAVFGRK
ncbi:MAG: TIGR02186 family protein [Proteobacteria bacterium]|nr:TIGR02186 family protein [Pseudomonadota bacterium]